MNNSIKFLVNTKDSGKRIDTFLASKIDSLTRSFIKKLIETNCVQLNKENISLPSKKIKSNDEIDIRIDHENNHQLKPKNIKLKIVYDDDDILVINKPKGMVVHPGAGNKYDTLANALAYKYKSNLSNLNGKLRPGIVHRIDKDTSGLLVVAKNNLAHSKLGIQFSNHSIKRVYQCLVWGVVRPLKGRIETLISRSKKNRQIMIVSDINGKKAITNYKTLKVFNLKNIPKISLIECELETGRTHQIRVHLKYKGTSLLGDNKYGKKNLRFKKIDKNFSNLLDNFSGQALHAKTLEFIHPKNNKWMKFNSELPLSFKKMVDLLENLSS